MKKKRLFVDIDGTMATWQAVSCEEQLLEEGFFLNMRPNQAVVEAVNILCKRKGIEVYSLSAYMVESPYALKEKEQWLANHTVIPKERQLYCPYGADKSQYVPGGIREDDVLLDDYTPNLFYWAKFARSVKLMNGINGTKGTWTGAAIDMGLGGEMLAECLAAYILNDTPLPERKNKDTADRIFLYSVSMKLADADYWGYAHEPYNRLLDSGKCVDGRNYELAWTETMQTPETVQEVHARLKNNKDAHVIVSSVIVLRQGNEEKAYYVDVGEKFKEVPEFLESRRKPKLYMHGWLATGMMGYTELRQAHGSLPMEKCGRGEDIFSKIEKWAPAALEKSVGVQALVRVYASDKNTEINDPAVQLIYNKVGLLAGCVECDGGALCFRDCTCYYDLMLGNGTNNDNLLAVFEKLRCKYVHLIFEQV